ncbi:MAG: hypothetical protein JRI99_08245, partial [Deltaproteobacteria bacterium]|nr:hypothetical protein [Deltaproteobacteria bacterium]
PGATFDPATQVFSWMPAYGQTGVYPNVLFTVTDDGDPAASDSETITIEVFAMPVPTVTLTTPAAGATFMAPAEITITADASVPGGTVAEVSFYANETLIGVDSTDPYSVTWSDVLEGSYSLTAIAMDSFGAETTSNPVTITVSNTPTDLVVFADSFETGLGEWVQDAQNDWFRSTQRALDGTYAAEVDGRATDAQLISVPIDLQGRTEATITYSWYIESGLDTGEYLAFDVSTDGGLTWVEKARLRGNADQENVWHDVIVELTDIVSFTLRFRGKMSLSSEDANIDGVTVTATWSGPAIDDPPIVSITEPLNGSEITGSVMISADAIDDTGISKVDFYVDDNLVDSDDVTPYEILWDTTTVSNGAHTIQVTAVDTASLTSSDSVNVTINNVMIDANFDSGSLQSYNVEGNTVNIVLNSESMDNNEDDYTYWVNFKVFNALNKDLTFNITGIDVVPFLAYQGTEENQMVYSCDGEIWNRLTQHGYSTDNGGTYTFTETFLCDEVQIATFFPFSYQRMHAYVDTVSSSPWASKTVLGLSSQGREIDLLTITNPAISGGDKEEIYIIGRQHAAETASSHMLKGMIDILISDDDDASAMRDHFVWYVVPMVNPDGVYEGNSRATSELRDLNRDWGNVESDEINTVRGNIELIDNPDDGIDMFIDWHNQMNDVGWYNFVYSPPGNTFFTDLSNWTDFDQEKSLTTSCTDESCSVRGYATDRGLFVF